MSTKCFEPIGDGIYAVYDKKYGDKLKDRPVKISDYTDVTNVICNGSTLEQVHSYNQVDENTWIWKDDKLLIKLNDGDDPRLFNLEIVGTQVIENTIKVKE